MKVTDMRLKKVNAERELEIILKTEEGEIHTFLFQKGMARRLMRAIFLQIGVDPKLKSRPETGK